MVRNATAMVEVEADPEMADRFRQKLRDKETSTGVPVTRDVPLKEPKRTHSRSDSDVEVLPAGKTTNRKALDDAHHIQRAVKTEPEVETSVKKISKKRKHEDAEEYSKEPIETIFDKFRKHQEKIKFHMEQTDLLICSLAESSMHRFDPQVQLAASCTGLRDGKGPKHLHIAAQMMEDFMNLARMNTERNLETCGVLAGSFTNDTFYVTALIIPKQESSSDSCQTLNEEEIFESHEKLGLFQLGWIHTHPSQSCFMSSIDLHTHYSYQLFWPADHASEAIAIVMSPKDSSRSYGIFRLAGPEGVKLIQRCQERGHHPHESPDDGSSLYEHCAHVYINHRLKFDVIDLRTK